jgi:hypothetical protein
VWSSWLDLSVPPPNNTPFTVGGVLRDGTIRACHHQLGWRFGDTLLPLVLRFWVYKFDNSGNDIANFSRIGEGTLQAGRGFTLKVVLQVQIKP